MFEAWGRVLYRARATDLTVFRVAGGQQAGAFGYGGGLDPAGDAELAQDVADVHAGGAGADVQLGADLGVGAPGGQQPQHGQLTVGQPVAGERPGRRRGLRVRRRRPGCSGIRARSARVRIWASRGACPSAAAAAARSGPAAAAAGCPASSCASACRHHAYPARCGQLRSCQALAAPSQAPGSPGPATRVRSASQVARSAAMVATVGWSVNGTRPICSTQAARPSAASAASAAADWSRRARACPARSAQARMPAASNRPHKMVRSGTLNRASARRVSRRASPGRPAHSRASAARGAPS